MIHLSTTNTLLNKVQFVVKEPTTLRRLPLIFGRAPKMFILKLFFIKEFNVLFKKLIMFMKK